MTTQADFKTVEREPDYEREAKESEMERQYALSVMNREINWRGYEESKFLTRRELGLILDYDKEAAEQQQDLITEKGPDYAQFFIHALETITSKETVEYILTLLEQLLNADPSRASYFHQIASNQVNIYAPFLRILTANQQGYSSYAQGKASYVLAILLASAPNPRNPALTQFLRYLITKINKSMHRELTVALTALKELLKRPEIQVVFRDEDGVNSLSQLLSRETQNTQLIYQVGFCIWLISYNPEVAPSIQESGIIRKLAMILKTATVEKVVRIALSTLKNLIELGDDAYAKEMIGLGLVKVLDTLSKRKWKDQDIVKDVDYISNNLQDTIRQLSSFEMYEAEVQSGNLQWSPVHKNELFWRENINLFDEKLVNILISKLDDSKVEDIVREVACYDVGEFARFHPDGKRIVQRLNGKSRLMGNLTHANPKVAKQALLAIQKIMVNNWESFNKSSTAGIASITSQTQNKK